MLGNDGVNGIDYLGLYNPEVRDPNNQPGFDDDPDDFPSLTLKGTGSISGGFSIVVYTATYMRLSGSLSLEHGECCDSSGELKEYQKISGTITGTVYTGTPTNLGGTWSWKRGQTFKINFPILIRRSDPRCKRPNSSRILAQVLTELCVG
jgi:hypothetical protein